MASRVYYYNESTAETTRTSSTMIDKVSLTFTPTANKVYALFWSGLARSANVNIRIDVQFNHDTAGALLGRHQMSSKDNSAANDYWSVGGVAIYESPASPASQTFSIEFANADNLSTVAVKECRIFALELGANDQYAWSAGNATNITTTFSSKATLTFTPASVGDYLVFGSAGVYNTDDFGDPAAIQLLHSGTAYGLRQSENDPNDNAGDLRYSWATMVKLTLAASSQTINVQTRNTVGTDTITSSYHAVVALRLSDFPDQVYGEARTRTTYATDTTFQDKATTGSKTFSGGFPGLVIGCGILDHSAATSSAKIQMVEGSTVLTSTMFKEANLNADRYSFFQVYRDAAITTSAETWKTQYGRSGGTAGLAESAIAVLQLEEAAAPGGTAVKDIIGLGVVPFAR